MATQKALKQMIPDLMKWINDNNSRLEYNKRIYNILEGNLLPEILTSLEKQLSPKAYSIASERVPPLNILRRIVDKLTKVYSDPCTRTAKDKNTTDQELIDYWENETGFDVYMGEANKFLNALKYVALEPYFELDSRAMDKSKYAPRLRVLPPHQFLVYSDDVINPLKPTVFIKIMPPVLVETKDAKGETKPLEMQLYHAYSDTEFIAFTADGNEYAPDMANGSINQYGRIPFKYISKSKYELIPQPESDTLALGILIPLLLTDLNFAVEFLSHSMVYTIDIEHGKLEMNPNALWDLKSVDGEKTAPQVGSINPSVEITSVLELIKQTLALWLETRNIKPGNVGTLSVSSVSSGIALMIEQADTTEDVKKQKALFLDAEKDFWYLISIMHNEEYSVLTLPKQYSKTFDILIKFADTKVIEDRNAMIDRLQKEVNAGFTSRKRAIKELNPDYSEDEIEELIEEIDEEKVSNMEMIPGENMDESNASNGSNFDKKKSNDAGSPVKNSDNISGKTAKEKKEVEDKKESEI